MMATEHCTIKRSILLFILVILAKIEILNGEMHLKAMPEKIVLVLNSILPQKSQCNQ